MDRNKGAQLLQEDCVTIIITHDQCLADLNQCYCHGNGALIVGFVVILFVGLEVGAGIEQL